MSRLSSKPRCAYRYKSGNVCSQVEEWHHASFAEFHVFTPPLPNQPPADSFPLTVPQIGRNEVWHCLDCDSWASLNENAYYHRARHGHSIPEIVKLSEVKKTAGFHIVCNRCGSTKYALSATDMTIILECGKCGNFIEE